MLVRALLEFGQKLDVNEHALKGAETPDALTLTATRSVSALAQLTAVDCEAVLQAFGASLTLKVHLDEQIFYVQIEAGVSQRSFDEGLAELRKRPGTTEVQVELKIVKEEILRQLSLRNETYYSLFYFFWENSAKLLAAPLLRLDTLLFTAPFKPTLIVVSETGARFNGKLLQIIGEDEASAVSQSPPVISKDLQEQLDRFYGDDASRPSWIGFTLRHLTPLHFIGDWSGTGSENVSQATTKLLLDLCLLFTANRTSYDEQSHRFQSCFSNSDRTIKLEFDQQPLTLQPTKLLAELADWISSGKDQDRRTIFQTIAARTLVNEDSTAAYTLFAQSLASLLAEARFHYRVFVDEKVDKHFEDIQKLSNYVAETAKKISENIDLVTKSVTDALLATIGVLVVTVLAALVKNDASTSIFMISLRVYAAYLVFYALYRMGSLWHSYVLTTKDAKEYVITYELKLGKEKVAEITKPVERRKYQFQIWYWVTVVLYVGVAIALWMAGERVPQYLKDHDLLKPPTASPTPSVTPGSTPTPAAMPTATVVVVPVASPVSGGLSSPKPRG